MIDDIFNSSETKRDKKVCIGTVTSLSDGAPLVRFDGETSVSQKIYKWLASYSSPAVNDRVLMIPISGSYVIIGKIV